jgi:hypothetical protein
MALLLPSVPRGGWILLIGAAFDLLEKRQFLLLLEVLGPVELIVLSSFVWVLRPIARLGGREVNSGWLLNTSFHFQRL